MIRRAKQVRPEQVDSVLHVLSASHVRQWPQHEARTILKLNNRNNTHRVRDRPLVIIRLLVHIPAIQREPSLNTGSLHIQASRSYAVLHPVVRPTPLPQSIRRVVVQELGGVIHPRLNAVDLTTPIRRGNVQKHLRRMLPRRVRPPVLITPHDHKRPLSNNRLQEPL